jgi:methylation protein EvaC
MVVSYGATSKSTTVFNYCGIDINLITHIFDTTPEKQGKLLPGVHIPVVSYNEKWSLGVDYAFIGAWNYEKEIMNKESEYVERGGKFISHVPTVRVLP